MSVRRKIARAAVFALVLLAGMEAALQAGHFLVRARALRSAVGDPGAPVIVCLGDSHTFGAGVQKEEAFPARLEQLLRGRGLRVNVVNLGVPGTNTSEVRRQLPRILDYYRPEAVIVLAGVNNGWNRRDAAWSDRQDGLPVPARDRVHEFLATRVRTVRAAQVLLRRLEWAGAPEELARDRAGNIVFHDRAPKARPEPPEAQAGRVRRDLAAVIAQARARGATPILMTYVTDPVYDFAVPNRLLRATARSLNAPLADNDLALRPLISAPDGGLDPAAREAMFFPDMHPRAAAYRRIAENAARTLEAAGALDRLAAP